VESLGKIADSKSLQGSRRQRWLTTQKERLLRGESGLVVSELSTLLAGRRTRATTPWLKCFVTDGVTHRRMDDSASRRHQLPIGSGAIESDMRRVINLRVRSNSTYWLREHAATLLRLRAWIKSGRGKEFFQHTVYVANDLVA